MATDISVQSQIPQPEPGVWFHVSCRFLFSGKKVTLDIFDHIFHFSLAFRISRTAEHGLEMLLVDKGTECSCQYEVTQVFSDQQDFVLVIDYPSWLPSEICESQFMGIYG